MKRYLRTLMVFLVFGAIINVAVAWGCALWAGTSAGIVTGQIAGLAWPMHDRRPTVKSIEVERFSGLGVQMIDYIDMPATEPVIGFRRVFAGWPLHSLAGEDFFNGDRQWLLRAPDSIARPSTGLMPMPRFLPFRPQVAGLAINTLFYAAILWGGWMLFAAPFTLRRRRRRKRGLCPACAYRVGTRDVCTECGKPVTPKAVEGIA